MNQWPSIGQYPAADRIPCHYSPLTLRLDMTELDPNSTYGALFIGLLFATFFQGILIVQLYMYYRSFPNDPLRIKILVVTLWCIDFVHLVLIIQSLYFILISNFGNLAALSDITRETEFQVALIGIAGFLCQAFFLHRLWMLSGKRMWKIIPLVAMCLLNLGIYVAMSWDVVRYSLLSSEDTSPFIAAIFTIGAGVDITIAILLVYYLRRGKTQTSHEVTNNLLNTIIYYTVTTGLATSLVCLACLIAYITSSSSVFEAIQYSLGRVYTNALVASLNARFFMRATLAGDARATDFTTLRFAVQAEESQVGPIVLNMAVLPLSSEAL